MIDVLSVTGTTAPSPTRMTMTRLGDMLPKKRPTRE